jgi:hypothetical protein
MGNPNLQGFRPKPNKTCNLETAWTPSQPAKSEACSLFKANELHLKPKITQKNHGIAVTECE